ncbi:MAG: crossover junction endodeoxyribonuclease RuvC [Parcubacteria group bacterium Gr01-1014_20]|nr:MAG: crossover junction endodeoxyribonuclease RuvC [Parcubacteria group bacterium Gr01-1014_20]
MIALGIDPGFKRVGYGLVEQSLGKTTMIKAGLLQITSSSKAIAYKEIRDELEAIIKKFEPEVLGIEKLYFSKNQKTALAVSESRGVLLLCAAENNLLVREFSPNEMKLGITGYGLADKKAVAKMVRLTLGEPGLRVIDDVTDALALAILATSARRLSPVDK